ncbi:MAG: glycerol-3-phosphate responsive antiterminator [Bacillota bacterium]
MDKNFYHAVEQNPIIGAVKDFEGLEKSLQSDLEVIFILFGDICNIAEITEKITAVGKIALVHMDLIVGLSSKEISVDYIKNNTTANGIISTKLPIIKRAKELGLFTVYRIFVIDSMSLKNIETQPKAIKADFIEILPGTMPRTIQKICKISKQPVIAGGLISEKVEVMEALDAGAIAISTTNQMIWEL